MKQTPRIEVHSIPIQLAKNLHIPFNDKEEFDHLFIIAVDSDGKEFILRGGPNSYGAVLKGNAFLNGDGAYELLEYTPKHADWVAPKDRTSVVAYQGDDALDRFVKGQMMGQSIIEEGFDYNLSILKSFGIEKNKDKDHQNSNTFTFANLLAMGTQLVKPLTNKKGKDLITPGFYFSYQLSENWINETIKKNNATHNESKRIKQLANTHEAKVNTKQEKVAEKILDFYQINKSQLNDNKETKNLFNTIIAEKIHDYEEKNILNQEARVRFLEDCHQVGEYATDLGRMFNIRFFSKIGPPIQAATKSLINIDQNVGKLADILMGAAPMTLTGLINPLMAIFSAGQVICGLFSKSKQDKSLEFLSKALQDISHQIQSLGQFLQENFNQMFEYQKIIYEEIIRCYENLSTQIHSEIYEFKVPVMQSFRNLESDLAHLSDILNIRLDRLYLQRFGLTLSTIEEYTRTPSSKALAQLVATSAADNLVGQLAYWIVHESCSDTLNGRIYALGQLQKDDRERWIAQVLSSPATNLGNLIGFLAEYARYTLDTYNPSPIELNSEEMTLRTKGEGDCPFHAVLGEWSDSEQMIVCPDVLNHRKMVRDAIKTVADKKEDSRLKQLGKKGIEQAIMDGNPFGPKSQILLSRYRTAVSDQAKSKPEIWDNFERELKKYKTIKNYIETNGKPVGSQLFRDKFYDALNKNNGELRERMRSLIGLNKAYEEFNHLHDAAFDWEYYLTPELIKEYADHIAKPSQWFLPHELEIIAIVFKVTIIFYSDSNANSETLNRNQSKTVYVQFDDQVRHYEQLKRPVDDMKAERKQPSDIKYPVTIPTVPKRQFISKVPDRKESKNELVDLDSQLAKLIIRCDELRRRNSDSANLELGKLLSEIESIQNKIKLLQPQPERGLTKKTTTTVETPIIMPFQFSSENLNIPNPAIWCDGVRCYLKVRSLLDEHKQIYDSDLVQIQDVLNVGSRFIRFIEFIQQSPGLFERLFLRYEEIVKEIGQQVANSLAWDALDNVQKIIQIDYKKIDSAVRYDRSQTDIVPEFKPYVTRLFDAHANAITRRGEEITNRIQIQRKNVGLLLLSQLTTEEVAGALEIPLTTLATRLHSTKDGLHLFCGSYVPPNPIHLHWDRPDGYSLPLDCADILREAKIPNMLLLAEILGIVRFEINYSAYTFQPTYLKTHCIEDTSFKNKIIVSMVIDSRSREELFDVDFTGYIPNDAQGGELYKCIKKIYDIRMNYHHAQSLLVKYMGCSQLARALQLIYTINSPVPGQKLKFNYTSRLSSILADVNRRVSVHIQRIITNELPKILGIDEKNVERLDLFKVGGFSVKNSLEKLKAINLLLVHYFKLAGFSEAEVRKFKKVFDEKRITEYFESQLKNLQQKQEISHVFIDHTKDDQYQACKEQIYDKFRQNSIALANLKPPLLINEWEYKIRTLSNQIMIFINQVKLNQMRSENKQSLRSQLVDHPKYKTIRRASQPLPTPSTWGTLTLFPSTSSRPTSRSVDSKLEARKKELSQIGSPFAATNQHSSSTSMTSSSFTSF